MATPADPEEPRFRPCDRTDRRRRPIALGELSGFPSVEPTRRRRRVEACASRCAARGAEVMTGIQEHVAKRVAYLARRGQKAEVVTIREHFASPASDAIHGAGDSTGDRLHPAAQRTSIARFEDQVSVVALKRVVHKPKAWSCARDQLRSMARTMGTVRSDGTPRRARSVTCAGSGLEKSCRDVCGSPRSGPGYLPALFGDRPNVEAREARVPFAASAVPS